MECSICGGPAASVFSYRMFGADRWIESPLCRRCAEMHRQMDAVEEFGPVEESSPRQ